MIRKCVRFRFPGTSVEINARGADPEGIDAGLRCGLKVDTGRRGRGNARVRNKRVVVWLRRAYQMRPKIAGRHPLGPRLRCDLDHPVADDGRLLVGKIASVPASPMMTSRSGNSVLRK